MKKSRARGRRGHGDDRLSPKDPIEPAGAARDALGELRVTYAYHPKNVHAGLCTSLCVLGKNVMMP